MKQRLVSSKTRSDEYRRAILRQSGRLFFAIQNLHRFRHSNRHSGRPLFRNQATHQTGAHTIRCGSRKGGRSHHPRAPRHNRGFTIRSLMTVHSARQQNLSGSACIQRPRGCFFLDRIRTWYADILHIHMACQPSSRIQTQSRLHTAERDRASRLNRTPQHLSCARMYAGGDIGRDHHRFLGIHPRDGTGSLSHNRTIQTRSKKRIHNTIWFFLFWNAPYHRNREFRQTTEIMSSIPCSTKPLRLPYNKYPNLDAALPQKAGGGKTIASVISCSAQYDHTSRRFLHDTPAQCLRSPLHQDPSRNSQLMNGPSVHLLHLFPIKDLPHSLSSFCTQYSTASHISQFISSKHF